MEELVKNGGCAGTGRSSSEDRQAPNPSIAGPPGAGDNAATSALPDLNFPLPGEQGPACLVKVLNYDCVYMCMCVCVDCVCECMLRCLMCLCDAFLCLAGKG